MIPLSTDLIENYITATYDPETLQEFYNMRFHLEKELILKLKRGERSGNVTSDHRLKLKRDHFLNELNFPPRVAGRLVNMYFEPTWPWGQKLMLQVEFDTPPGMVLTFAPTGKWGVFAVNIEGILTNRVVVNGTEYICSWGCKKNRLLVPICLLEKFNINRRVARGYLFPN